MKSEANTQFKLIWSNFLYGKVGKNFFKRNSDTISNINYGTLKLISYVSVLVFLVIITLSLSSKEFHKLLPSYIIGLALSLAALLFVLFFIKKHMTITTHFYRLFEAVGYSIGIYVGVAQNRNLPSGIVLVMLIVFPLVILEKPVNSYIFTICVCAVFIIMSAIFKDGEPFKTDLYNGITTCLISITTTYRVRTMHLNSIQLSLIYQSKAETDKLTGIANKDSTDKLCMAYLDNVGMTVSCALMVIDVDDFKHVNDTFGHKQGDEVLCQFGMMLRDIFRESDIVGRIGGDEFLVLMKDIKNPLISEIKATEILQKVKGIMGDISEKKLSCSIGIATCNSSEISYATMFGNADKALYDAKEQGKGRYILFSEKIVFKDSTKPCILVADDDQPSRAIIASNFKHDFNVIQAVDGSSALMIMQQYANKIDVCLLDIEMPGLNGYEVLSKLKSDKKTKGIPVIMITAFDNSELQFLNMGAVDYIRKPFDIQIVKRRVELVLDKHGRSE